MYHSVESLSFGENSYLVIIVLPNSANELVLE